MPNRKSVEANVRIENQLGQLSAVHSTAPTDHRMRLAQFQCDGLARQQGEGRHQPTHPGRAHGRTSRPPRRWTESRQLMLTHDRRCTYIDTSRIRLNRAMVANALVSDQGLSAVMPQVMLFRINFAMAHWAGPSTRAGIGLAHPQASADKGA